MQAIQENAQAFKGDPTMNELEHHNSNDFANDASLLEGLYQLVVTGHTDGWEFEQLDHEVYGRLKNAYAVAN